MRGTLLLVALAVPAAAIVYDGVDYPWISNRSCSDDPDDCPGLAGARSSRIMPVATARAASSVGAAGSGR